MCGRGPVFGLRSQSENRRRAYCEQGSAMKNKMTKTIGAFLILLAMAAAASAQKAAAPASKLAWQPWSDKVFADAKRENRFVLLDLEAVWCHWCHVMDANTYSDPTVIKLLQSRYIVVKVDQDSRPDLSARYEDYGWPAAGGFAGAGHQGGKT